MMREPNPPTGNSAIAAWCRKLLDYVRSIRLVSGPGYRLRPSSLGTTLELFPGGGGAESTARRFRVKSVQGDYATCRTWDGSVEGDSDVNIAKPPQLRHTITSQTVNTVSVAYSGHTITDGVCTRVASATGYDSQNEMVLPVWQLAGTGKDAELFAIQPDGGTGVDDAPDWLDLNVDGRAWCELYPVSDVLSSMG